ncbi:arginine repressor [Caldisericum sp.]|uniref:arginine repressor n=1 Tax=Caldisericum sp. TaxID=2499687 RepID=UPI003D0F54EC
MKNMNNVASRIKIIKEILLKKRIHNQKELQEELKRLGIKVTQATIARDFKKLNVLKIRKNGESFYALGNQKEQNSQENLRVAFKNFARGIDFEENLVLVFTSPGNASGLASLIDTMKIEGIVGTIAGDDTILIVTRKEYTEKIVEFLKRLL